MHYDNIEIGTSNWCTLIQDTKIKGNGISVEPNKEQIDMLPDREGWKKINVALGYDGVAILHKVKQEHIPVDKKYLGGTSMIDQPIRNRQARELPTTTCEVECQSGQTFVKKNNITSIGLLKLDCENYDSTILMQILEVVTEIGQIQIESGHYNNWGRVNNKHLIDYVDALRLLEARSYSHEVIKGDTLWIHGK